MTPQSTGPVFLAGAGRRTWEIESLLIDAGLEFLTSADYEGQPVWSLKKTVERCSGVVGYVTRQNPPAGTLLEIGAGVGQGLPTVLVLGRKVRLESLSPALQDLPSMRLPDPDSATGHERLRSLLEVAQQHLTRSNAPVVPVQSVPVYERSDWGNEQERQVGTLLEGMGVSIFGYESDHGSGAPDFAAWVPGLSGTPYNPILVELARHRADRRSKEAQVREYMRRAGALLGLVVFQEPQRSEWKVQSDGAVFFTDIDYLASLTSERLTSLLLEGRNRLFHVP